MTVLLILLLTLDFQRTPLADEAMAKSFAVTTLENEATTGCATNPQSGGTHSLIIERSDPPELPTENTANWVSPVSGNAVNDNLQPMTVVSLGGNYQSMVAVLPGDSPPIPVSATPEPSTVAILGITAVVLLFLLFGRRCGRKVSR